MGNAASPAPIVTLNLFQGPSGRALSRLKNQTTSRLAIPACRQAARWMLKQVQHDARFLA
jgi:hypothetical protein